LNFEIQEQKLLKMGWGPFFRSQLTADELQNALVARIVEPLRGLSRAACVLGEIWAEGPQNVGVGDWVVGTVRGALEKEKRLTITRVLDRKTKLSRNAPSGKKYEQILCANADSMFVVVALTQALHLAGILRAVEAARAGGIAPVLILTKSDVCENPAEIVASVTQKLKEVPIHLVSILKRKGLEALAGYFGSANTVVLLGASGAGKSTLTNHFTGSDDQCVGETRESDEKGRHTTTARRLHFLPSGGMIVDSPGIRELQLWTEPEPRADTKRKEKKPKRSHRSYEDD